MTIKLSRVAPNLYTAIVTPPHSGADWVTPEPIRGRKLIKLLRAMGCRQHDIADAFYAVDRDWISKLEPRHVNLPRKSGWG